MDVSTLVDILLFFFIQDDTSYSKVRCWAIAHH